MVWLDPPHGPLPAQGHSQRAGWGRSLVGERGMLQRRPVWGDLGAGVPQDWAAQRTVWGTSSQSPCRGDSAVLGIPAPGELSLALTPVLATAQHGSLFPFPQLSATSYPTSSSNTSPSKTPLHLCLSLVLESDPKHQPLASVSSLSFLALIVTWKAEIVSSCS